MRLSNEVLYILAEECGDPIATTLLRNARSMEFPIFQYDAHLDDLSLDYGDAELVGLDGDEIFDLD